MKKLEKKFNKQRNTVEAYAYCFCYCPCNFCAAYYESQYDADTVRNSKATRDA